MLNKNLRLMCNNNLDYCNNLL